MKGIQYGKEEVKTIFICKSPDYLYIIFNGIYKRATRTNE